MNIFFDCEFTKLPGSQGGYPGLISVGCAAEDGRQGFYAELTDTWQPGNCSEFVLKNVVPLLGNGRSQMTEAECALKLRDWIEALPSEEVTMRSDNPLIDWPWAEHLFHFFGCWPKNLRRRCGAIAFEYEGQQGIFDEALLKYWSEPLNAMHCHHALFDANSLVFAWWYAHALVISDKHFRTLVDNLNKKALEDGDNGYRYWTDVVDDLKDMRINYLLHKEAIRRFKAAPACLDAVLTKLAEKVDQDQNAGLGVMNTDQEWQKILQERDWEAALAISKYGNELRILSPCRFGLTEEERLEIIGQYRRS